ncbi:AMP-binding protein [Branchiibius hedensis]|uniref:AMP-binding protein n=1 Tax=Branchiibius hedensis TaxID=672460 RepID=UPI000D6BB756|nr:AMP-binding protein [Branchiibius hedensis]
MIDATGSGEPTIAGTVDAAAAHESVPLPDDTQLIMFTSGTTGRAKAVPLTAANVQASIDGIATTLELGPTDRTLAVMPLFHGHGLFTTLLATLATGGLVQLPAKYRFSASTFWPQMQQAGATWFTAVPTMHQILLMRAQEEFPGASVVPLRFIRSCSAPLAAPVATELETTFGAPVVSAYGMTETAHQTASTTLPDRGPRVPQSVGKPVGVTVRVIADDGSDLPPETDGEVVLKGATLTPGYLGGVGSSSFEDGWFHTGDVGRLDKDGNLFITGRIKDLINRGGEKIAPAAVQQVLLSHSAIEEAVVFGQPDPLYGETVAAAIVPADGAEIDVDEIRSFCAAHLAAFAVPAHIFLVTSIPHTAKGAPDRTALAEQLASRSS